MRHGPPARDGIPPLHSDGEALPEVARLSCVTSDDRDTPAELGHKLLTMHPQAPSDSKASGTKACVMAICAYFAFSPLPPLPLLNLLAWPIPPDVTPLMYPVTSHPT